MCKAAFRIKKENTSTVPLHSGRAHARRSDALTLEARRTDDERLLEGVGPGSAELRSSRLQGHAPLGHGCHGGGGGLVECRLVV